MITRIFLAAGSLILAGCTASAKPPAQQPATEEQSREPQRPSPGMFELCNARPVQAYVGEQVTEEIGAKILSESGSASLRWGPPRSAWSMDYRSDRVNVRYDDNSTITAITCG